MTDSTLDKAMKKYRVKPALTLLDQLCESAKRRHEINGE